MADKVQGKEKGAFDSITIANPQHGATVAVFEQINGFRNPYNLTVHLQVFSDAACTTAVTNQLDFPGGLAGFFSSSFASFTWTSGPTNNTIYYLKAAAGDDQHKIGVTLIVSLTP